MKYTKLFSLVTASAIALSFAGNISKIQQSSIVNAANKYTFSKGTYKVGKQIKPGRYIIKATNGFGNVSSSGAKKTNDFVVLLSDGNDKTLVYPNSYTVDLTKNEKIKVQNLNQINLTKISTKKKYCSVLPAGQWKAGRDFKPGKYTIKAIIGEGNNLSDNFSSKNWINKILGTKNDKSTGQVTQTKVVLKKVQSWTQT